MLQLSELGARQWLLPGCGLCTQWLIIAHPFALSFRGSHTDLPAVPQCDVVFRTFSDVSFGLECLPPLSFLGTSLPCLQDPGASPHSP